MLKVEAEYKLDVNQMYSLQSLIFSLEIGIHFVIIEEHFDSSLIQLFPIAHSMHLYVILMKII